ncbi:MAG: bifunctional riboflavin kinase/FAD synthetase [Alphaproteobacteria bacterium]|nr:bifunctional riboflavin kinase/FAD synthetase [Alphaproteobacteria bacterium]
MSAQVFRGARAFHSDTAPVLSIGNFDGVHLGHRALLARLLERAEELDAPSCVFTFEPPPRRVLQPDRCPPRILSLADKLRLLGEFGVDQIIVERFDLEFSRQPAEWFADEILRGRVQPAAMVVGYDFRFGAGRRGDAALLQELWPGLPLEALDAVQLNAHTASSSRIREAVASGRLAEAAELLGRPHFIRGRVVRGDARGRTLGFPTANLEVESELLPSLGVYAVRTTLEGGEVVDGVANLGVRPTFEGRRFSVEVHLLDVSLDLYDQHLKVDFIERLRGEQRFSGVEALVAQIGRDVARAREVLGEATR